MYVVRRAFRNNNRMMTPGSIVEPGAVKWFKTRLRDRKIIEIREDELDTYEEYFKQKFGVSLKAQLEAADKSEGDAPDSGKTDQTNDESGETDQTNDESGEPAQTNDEASEHVEPVKPTVQATEKVVVKAVQ